MTTQSKFRLALFTLSLAAFSLAAFQIQSAEKDAEGAGVPPKASVSKPAPKVARVGQPAPDFELVDQFGKAHTLSQYEGKVVVLEWINPNCPFVKRHYQAGTMVNLQEKFGKSGKNVVWLRINSTHISHPDYYDAKATQAWAKKNKVEGAVLDDSRGTVGHLFDAKTTPHMFIVNAKGVLVYSGAIDNDPRGSKAADKTENYVDAILTGWKKADKIKPFANDSYGCNVKYKK
ncbi:MAG: redoxin domain-containing protein [Candidatus Zixiibacteriota bacterium]